MTDLDALQEEAYCAGYEQATENARETADALAQALRSLIASCQCANQRVMYEATAALAHYEIEEVK